MAKEIRIVRLVIAVETTLTAAETEAELLRFVPGFAPGERQEWRVAEAEVTDVTETD